MSKHFDEDPDNPELTTAEWAGARRGLRHLPAPVRQALEETRRHRGRQVAPVKERITIRLSQPVLAAYRASGRGWQGRIDQDLSTLVAKRAPVAKTSARTSASSKQVTLKKR